MALTILTAMIITSNPNLIFTHAGPNKDGKYTGWITMGEDDYCRPLLNTEAIFDSVEAAEAHMYDVRIKCIKMMEEE